MNAQDNQWVVSAGEGGELGHEPAPHALAPTIRRHDQAGQFDLQFLVVDPQLAVATISSRSTNTKASMSSARDQPAITSAVTGAFVREHHAHTSSVDRAPVDDV